MSGRLLSHVAVFSIALSLALDVLPRVVLCIGPNGHNQIELLNIECCHRGSAASAAVGEPERECDDCTDTPLSGGPAVTSADHAHQSAVDPGTASVSVTVNLFPSSLERSILLTRFGTSAHSHRVLHIIIIRC